MILLQQKIVVGILNPIIRQRNRLVPEKSRKRIFDILLTVLFLIQVFVSYLLPLSFMMKIILLTILVGATLIFAVPNELPLKKFRKILMCPVYIISISFLMTGIVTKTVGYIAYSIIFGVILPFIIVVLGNLGSETLYTAVSKAMQRVFYVVLVTTFLAAPILNAQYSSVFGNPNALSNFMAIILPTQFYLLEKEQGKKRIKHIIFAAVAIVFCLYSAARTGMLCLALIIAVYIYYLLRNHRKSIKDILFKIGGTAISTFAFYFIILFLLTKGTGAILSIEEKLTGMSYTVTAPLYTPGEEEDAGVENVTERFVERMEKGVNDGASFSSGRVDIWKGFIENIGVVGHRRENLLVKKRYYSEPKWCYAHNSFLQIAYSGGLFAGISLSALWCMLGVLALKERVKDLESMILLAFLLSSGLQMMLGSNYSPYQEITHLVVWVLITPVFTAKKDAGTQTKRKE